MEIRPIDPREMPEAHSIYLRAFSRADPPGYAPDPLEYKHVRAAYVDGRMAACLTLFPFQTQLDGRMLPAVGVGDVSTLPEYRLQGCARALMESALAEMRLTGVALSMLYPFSHAFYRKFGYAFACPRQEAYLPLRQLSGRKAPGFARAWRPGEDAADIKRLYAAFIRGRNLACDRDALRFSAPLWADRLVYDPASDGRETYLWYAPGGEALAYAQLCRETFEGRRILRLRDFAYDGARGLNALLVLLSGLREPSGQVVWRIPDDLRPQALLPEPNDAPVALRSGGMARVIDPALCLSALKTPRGTGRFTLRITDAQITANSGAYRVSFDHGASHAERLALDAPCDIDLPVRALAPLVLGAFSYDDWLCTPGASPARANEDTLRAVFARKSVYLNEIF